MGIVVTWLGKPRAMKALQAARELLSDVTPLKTDCGRLCDGACCQSDESGENGMLLFPYEDRLYRKPIPGFDYRLVPDSTVVKGGFRLVCEGQCPREHRPLACRLFPLRLRIVFQEDGNAVIAKPEIDPRAWVCCPLPEQGRLNAFHADFVTAVEEAGTLLAQNLFQLEFLTREQDVLDEMRRL